MTGEILKELVSIVIPVYNCEHFLDRCISSVITQSYENVEVILVDDGSSDSSSAICDRWEKRDARIRVIHKENAGAGFARNTGLEHAEGKYILFVDSDDYIDPLTVEKCVDTITESGADMVMFGRNNVFSEADIRPQPVITDRHLFEGNDVLCDILPGLFTYARGIGISVWGKLFTTSLIKDNGVSFPSERELISEDAFFLLDLFAYIDSVAVLPECLYYYVKNEASFSRTYKREHRSLNDAFLRESLSLCEKRGYPAEIARCVKSRYHTYALVGMKQIVASNLKRGEKSRALKDYYRDEYLHSTLTEEVIALDIRPSRVFWRLFSKKCYFICRMLLAYKARRSHRQ